MTRSHACLWRRWLDGNNTELTGWTYSVETMFHELLLQSEHRCGWLGRVGWVGWGGWLGGWQVWGGWLGLRWSE